MNPSTSLGTRSNVGMAKPSPPVRQAGNIWRLLVIHLTITHIDFLSVWPRASLRPAMSSHAGHATRSARRASHPSDDSGDRRDGLSTTPLGLASASTPLALCQTWP